MWKFIGGFSLFACVYLSLLLGFSVGYSNGIKWHPKYDMCQNFCGGPLANTDMKTGILGFGETVCTCKEDGKQLRY